ncbi:4Fe-4S binding protein [Nonomuraea africana]|uniref:4Fe-4S binding protein n=1 Tax=Nonomuraea africana TaxID=46171 RepID=UPI0033C7A932
MTVENLGTTGRRIHLRRIVRHDVGMARIPGVGLVKGLSVTLRHMLRRSVTQQYPEVHPELPARSRGVIALVEENCTSCMLCARECPDWCIYIDSHKETLPAPEGGRARQRNVLDRFAIDFALCMYCGICIEVCPFDALFWSPEFEYAEGDIRNLLHEKDKLATWVETVPPPPAHEVGAEPPKELAAGARPPRTAGRTARGETGAGEGGRPGAGAERRARTEATGEPTSPSSEGEAAGAPGTAGPSGTAGAPGQAGVPGTAGPTGTTVSPGRTGASGSAGPSGTAGEAGRAGAPRVEGAPGQAGARGAEGASGTAGRPAGQGSTGESTDKTSPNRPSVGTPEAQGQARPQRRTRMGDVRGIRPPGALPPEPQRPAPDASSTGRPSEEELSTGSGASSPQPPPEGQTSATEPRRRRMADPRTIRPPGGLKRDNAAEPEED